MKTTLDRFGRVLIPMEVRDHLGLNPGAVLEIVELEETILLKPKNDKVHVVVKAGVLVFSGTAIGDVASARRIHREEHLKKVTPLLAQNTLGLK